MATGSSSTVEEDSWIVVDDTDRDKDGEIDELVLNPMSAKARLNNSFFRGIRSLKQKVSSSTRRLRSNSEANAETVGTPGRPRPR